jgi:hypothetical protein
MHSLKVDAMTIAAIPTFRKYPFDLKLRSIWHDEAVAL